MHGFDAYTFSWAKVQKYTDQVRVYSHAGNTRLPIGALVNASDAWAAGIKQGKRASLEDRI